MFLTLVALARDDFYLVSRQSRVGVTPETNLIGLNSHTSQPCCFTTVAILVLVMSSGELRTIEPSSDY